MGLRTSLKVTAAASTIGTRVWLFRMQSAKVLSLSYNASVCSTVGAHHLPSRFRMPNSSTFTSKIGAFKQATALLVPLIRTSPGPTKLKVIQDTKACISTATTYHAFDYFTSLEWLNQSAREVLCTSTFSDFEAGGPDPLAERHPEPNVSSPREALFFSQTFAPGNDLSTSGRRLIGLFTSTGSIPFESKRRNTPDR